VPLVGDGRLLSRRPRPHLRSLSISAAGRSIPADCLSRWGNVARPRRLLRMALMSGAPLDTLAPTKDGGGVHGVELHQASAEQALALLKKRGVSADLRVGNFFDYTPPRQFDAVVGNPPYVRYQDSLAWTEQRARLFVSFSSVNQPC
jgi:hypothetical protein